MIGRKGYIGREPSGSVQSDWVGLEYVDIRQKGDLARSRFIIIGAIKEDIQKDDLAREPTPREARSMPAFAREMRKVE